MRRFSLGSAADRKVVTLDVRGATLSVVRMKPDGATSRQEQELPSEAAARAAGEKVAQELLGRGYVEHGREKPATAHSSPARPRSEAAAANGAHRAAPPDASGPSGLFDDLELVEPTAPPLARLAPAPSSTGDAPRKPKKKAGKKGKGQKNPDALDRRVLAVFAAVGLAIVGGIGYMAYDLFLKPASIIGVWKGSMVEHEIGRSLTYTAYSLTLDGRRRATMAVDESSLSGTYSVKGSRLLLKFKDEDGDPVDREYRIKLDRATLALIDPDSGKLLVDLVRQFRQPEAESQAKADVAKDLVDEGARKADPEADKALASVEFGAKDGAFKLRHPPGWTAQTGGRPDNTYSYINLEKDPFKILTYADVTGSLVSGSDSANPGDFEEGSEFAPVHKAHEHFAKTGTGELADYQEGKPEVFKDSALGEGRISVFTASSGLFGEKLKGYHVTQLTRDRRVSVLAYGPESDFAKLRPTYLAVCRSLAQ
ncbi:hypothetical protein [Planctomyces sp. SH-PL62]|uniref:hypothetical protein n=1 Tax=Planctomyces sp. SH-PL62 TaxID=1636152 RepID=UPI00078E8F8B|nr:hypothetical protein [Planctomyces sp. SH-PL62]AMV36954.1 hypothetical protein VT85_05950 [Planctomyces sp. SH-PL62]